MSTSMTYLFVVAVAASVFEALSAAWFNAPDTAGQVLAGVFGAAMAICAWAMRARHSFVAASVIAFLLFVDVAGVPFYTKSSTADWVVQIAFGLVGAVGIAAWVNVFRARRHRLERP